VSNIDWVGLGIRKVKGAVDWSCPALTILYPAWTDPVRCLSDPYRALSSYGARATFVTIRWLLSFVVFPTTAGVCSRSAFLTPRLGLGSSLRRRLDSLTWATFSRFQLWDLKDAFRRRLEDPLDPFRLLAARGLGSTATRWLTFLSIGPLVALSQQLSSFRLGNSLKKETKD